MTEAVLALLNGPGTCADAPASIARPARHCGSPPGRPSDESMTEPVLALLNGAETHPDAPASIERHKTHGSYVFVAGDLALKVKKPVV